MKCAHVTYIVMVYYNISIGMYQYHGFLSLAGTRWPVGWILHTRCDFIYGVFCVGVLTPANHGGVLTIAYLCKYNIILVCMRVCVCVCVRRCGIKYYVHCGRLRKRANKRKSEKSIDECIYVYYNTSEFYYYYYSYDTIFIL